MRHYLMLIIMTFLLAGCAGDSSDNTTVLEGKWTSTCVVDGVDHIKFTITFSGNSLNFTQQLYIDSACSTVDVNVGLSSFSGNFNIGNSVTTNSGISATEYDINVLEGDGVTEEFSVFSLFNIIDEKLYVGDLTGENDGSTLTNRAVDLNFDFYYTKTP